jgi:hypothetical protein
MERSFSNDRAAPKSGALTQQNPLIILRIAKAHGGSLPSRPVAICSPKNILDTRRLQAARAYSPLPIVRNEPLSLTVPNISGAAGIT